MALHHADLPGEILAIVRDGAVIPAHLLALDSGRRLDRRRQRALTRYYIDCGVGGLAVGVHATQFAIRDVGLFEAVLAAAIEDTNAWSKRPLVMIAGICGRTAQAIDEARAAVRLGYHAGLVSLASFKADDAATMLAHCCRLSEEIPLVGFYLQPAVGGVPLDAAFWKEFAALDNVIAIKVAPFSRYRTLDVVRGVVAARAERKVTLYTGNDDHILLDLITPFTVSRDGTAVTVRFRGGLLGHWSVWTSSAVRLLDALHAAVAAGPVAPELLALASRITDCNSAFFDAAHEFRGCIAGCHEVLRRQGLFAGTWCLDPDEGLSAGQAEAIERVCREHADLSDDAFVAANLERWLS